MLGQYCVLGGCLAEIVFFLYKTGEAMLDAAIRPYIIRAVCEDLTRDVILVNGQWAPRQQSFDNVTMTTVEPCFYLKELPDLERDVQERSVTLQHCKLVLLWPSPVPSHPLLPATRLLFLPQSQSVTTFYNLLIEAFKSSFLQIFDGHKDDDDDDDDDDNSVFNSYY
ncbi:solute carrier family 46 member 3 [Elysia marginata]|uniref:Solute carrier family 46 member 3 n=1 Tax=Elysia marginata TaxID=1093978 RepID=A0AAV4G535_9GAST|nr:solute carrier family 46 member 3 [Elysia marginata]